MSFLFWPALVTLVAYLIAALDLVLGNRTLQSLRDVSPRSADPPIPVSIIVPARNEQRHIRAALQSLLQLDYPEFELIVVDDRSEDGTGLILDEMAAASCRLKVIHVRELPTGWLGKNHALWLGSRSATGALLLFTDADIVMEPTMLRRAVAFLENNRLDHLAAIPSMRMPTLFLSMFGTAFIIFFSLFTRPWKARDPLSSCHIGIGAFNLVRGEVYRKVGGHETIRLRPDDDIKLGKIIKKGGFCQDLVLAPEFMAVEWYSSIAEVIRGLEKNAFSGVDYNILLVLCASLFHIFCSIWPFCALLVTHGAVQAMYGAVVALIVLIFADSARCHRGRWWHVIGYPLTTALFVYILLRTMLLNLVQGGIRWRGTFYPLRELKGNRV